VLVATAATALALGLEPYAERPRKPHAQPAVEETTAAVPAPQPARVARTGG
jgi:hypothetical protein